MKLTDAMTQATAALKQKKQPSQEIIAALLALTVDEETRKQRMAICSTCDQIRVSETLIVKCGAPGCKECSSPGGQIQVLARYKEQLPDIGCKHPQRSQGKGWPLSH